MYVFHAWHSSLQLFIPSNFKLFLLVTLKTAKSTYQHYIRYGWPLILLIIFGFGAAPTLQEWYGGIISKEQLSEYSWSDLIALYGMLIIIMGASLAYIYSYFLTALCARPSVNKKDCAYLRSYTKRYFFWYLLLISSFNLLTLAFLLVPSIIQFLSCIYSIMGTFAILFLLDLGGGFKSIFYAVWFSIKMLFYNLPFVIIIASVFYIKDIILGNNHLISLVLYPLFFCFIMNYYTKKVYDQARLYQGV